MGIYHNKLDKKYFNKSVYIKKFEKEFGIKIKDYPLQYELIFETYNTLIMLNNNLFSTNYIKISSKVDNIIHLLSSYLNRYKTKINKCYDSNCINLYYGFESELDELKDMKETYKSPSNYNLKHLEDIVSDYMTILNLVDFDKLKDIKELPYKKIANDKLPKKINLKIFNELDLIESNSLDISKLRAETNNFCKKYYEEKGIDLKVEKDQFEYIIQTLYMVENIYNSIVDYYIYEDKTILNIHMYTLDNYLKKDNSYIKDISITNITNKLKIISDKIKEDKIDSSFEDIQVIIKQFDYVFERIS